MSAFAFFQRPYPSANCVLLHGERPVLVDPGFGSDTDALLAWLDAQGTPPHRLSLIVNTHHHSDHVGANHRLQTEYGIPIAAHRWEAGLVNRRDPEACCARWLQQPVEPYTVDRPLNEHDIIDTGSTAWRVIHTPGHTLGHIGLHAQDLGAVVLGDAVHGDDIGWLNPYREGMASLDRSLESVAAIASLGAQTGCSGHGDLVTDIAAATAQAAARLRRWRDAPEAAAWHACKRIFAYGLIITDGLTEAEIQAALPTAPWFNDFALHAFGRPPAAFLSLLMAEMLRSGAARWDGNRLRATAPYNPGAPGWQTAPGLPTAWHTG